MKQIIKNYTIDASAKKVTLTNFVTVRLDRLQLIIDVTTNQILYNFADSSVSTATIATNVVTLSTVGSASSTDKLQVVYDAADGDPLYDLPIVNLMKQNGVSLASPQGPGDNFSGTTAPNENVFNLVFNNSNFDRQRNNVNTGDTGTKTTPSNGATQTNYNARGAKILFNIGTLTGTTPTLVAKLQGSNDTGTTWYDIPGAVTPTINASSQTLLEVYPGVTPAANAAVSAPLPRTWRAVYTIGGTTPSFTITNVQVAYIL